MKASIVALVGKIGTPTWKTISNRRFVAVLSDRLRKAVQQEAAPKHGRFEAIIDKNATAGLRYTAWGNFCRAAMFNHQSFPHTVLPADEAVWHMHPTAR
jgi:hypothetical protein